MLLFTDCLEKLSEKGSERGFDRRFGQYTNAKTARKVSFRCPVRLRCRGVRYFSDSFSRNCLINRSRSYFGVPRASIRGQTSPILPPRASRTPRSGSPPAIYQTVSLGSSVNRGSCLPTNVALLGLRLSSRLAPSDRFASKEQASMASGTIEFRASVESLR